MMHPSETQLALFAGGDLDWMDRWRISRHVKSCPSCDAVVTSVRRADIYLQAETGDLPTGLNWDRLAAEMTGNIRVGLAAGECVSGSGRKEKVGWRAAAVLASATLLLSVAWWLNIGSVPRSKGVTLEATQNGIQLKQDGSSLMILNRRNSSTPVYASTPGSLRVRYVDTETNQVTINNVYAQ